MWIGIIGIRGSDTDRIRIGYGSDEDQIGSDEGQIGFGSGTQIGLACEIECEMQRDRMGDAARQNGRSSSEIEWQIVSLPDPNEGGQLM